MRNVDYNLWRKIPKLRSQYNSIHVSIKSWAPDQFSDKKTNKQYKSVQNKLQSGFFIFIGHNSVKTPTGFIINVSKKAVSQSSCSEGGNGEGGQSIHSVLITHKRH